MLNTRNTLGTTARPLAACILAAALLTGCGSSSGDDTTKEAAPVKAANGSVQPNVDNPMYKRILDNAKETVDTARWKKPGPYKIVALTQGPVNGWGTLFDAQIKAAAAGNPDVKSLEVKPSMADPQQETKDLELAVTQKPDAIVVTPMSVAALSAPITRAKAAGIPVITCLGRSDGSGWVTEVGQPLYPMAFEAVSHLAKMLGGRGDIVQINGIPGVDAGEIWKAGAADALKAYPGLKVVAQGDANWSPADAKKLVTGMIASHSKIDGVLTMGMEMGVGALNAFSAAGRKIPPMSGTGSQNGFNRLASKEDVKFWSVSYAGALSKVCVDTAVDVLKGTSVPKYVDGTKKMPGKLEFASATAKADYRADLSDEFPLGPQAMTPAQLQSAFGKR